MSTVNLKYTGGRIFVKNYYNRRPYVFKKETGYTCEVPEELSRELLVTGKYGVAPTIVVNQEPITTTTASNLVCDVCGFEAKSEQGLIVHKSRKHK